MTRRIELCRDKVIADIPVQHPLPVIHTAGALTTRW